MPKVSLLHGEEIPFKCWMHVMPLKHLDIHMISYDYKNIYVYTHIYFYVIVFVI